MSINLRFVLAAALALSSAAAFAATPAPSKMADATTAPVAKKALSSSQQRMSDCSKQNAGKKGDERKMAMSMCLKGESAMTAAAPTAKQTPQEKMKACNADAKVKAPKGDAHKAFMSSCLKGDAAAAPAPAAH